MVSTCRKKQKGGPQRSISNIALCLLEPLLDPQPVFRRWTVTLRINVTEQELYQPVAPQEKSFLEFLHSWGGTWMWKGLAMPADKKCLTDAVANNMLMCLTDGSYSQEKAPDICGAGWIVYCIATKQHICATLVE